MQATELEDLLEELEIRLERLRALYEQYFLGIEKIEPNVARKDVDRRFWLLRREQIRNTARRFKLQTLVQRYNTYQQYWHRVCREIDSGTYKRHVLRAEKLNDAGPLTIATKRRAGMFRKDATQAAEPAPDNGAEPLAAAPSVAPIAAQRPVVLGPAVQGRLEALGRLDLDMDFFESPRAHPPPAAQTSATAAGLTRPAAVRATRPPPPAAPPALKRAAPVAPPPTRVKTAPEPPRPANLAAERQKASAGAGLSEERVRELHARLVEIKRKNNEPANVSIDGLAKSLRAAETRLREQHADRRIDFDVVIKDGKAVVKPILR